MGLSIAETAAIADAVSYGGGSGGGGITPSGTISIEENGIYNVAAFASASVDVPSFEPEGTISITNNGFKNVYAYMAADVQVAPKEVTVTVVNQSSSKAKIHYSEYNVDMNIFTIGFEEILAGAQKAVQTSSGLFVELECLQENVSLTLSYMLQTVAYYDSVQDVKIFLLRPTSLQAGTVTIANA